MVLLSEKAAHGISARHEKVCMLLPQRSQGSTLKNHMFLIANSTTVASPTNPASPVYMASASQPTSSNRQAMTAQPNLRKSPHAPPKNRKLTIPHTWATRLKPLLVCAAANTLAPYIIFVAFPVVWVLLVIFPVMFQGLVISLAGSHLLLEGSVVTRWGGRLICSTVARIFLGSA